jgi:hypothetical protein
MADIQCGKFNWVEGVSMKTLTRRSTLTANPSPAWWACIVAQPVRSNAASPNPSRNHTHRAVGSVPQRIRQSFWAVVSTIPPQTLQSSGIQTELVRGTIPGGINRWHRGQKFRTGRRRVMFTALRGDAQPASSPVAIIRTASTFIGVSPLLA